MNTHLEPPFVLIETPGAATRCFTQPVRQFRADAPGEIDGALRDMEAARRAGLHVAGFVAYEAGTAFEPRLRRLAAPSSGPLLCFGAFEAPTAFDWSARSGEGAIAGLEPAWSRQDYASRFERVIDYIRAGDVYQINLTFPLHGRWTGDPIAIYAALRQHQPAPFGALVALGDETILSLSPELFFETAGRTIRVRPMKGTASRGIDALEDERSAHDLAASPKNRAENLMIVDLLRNDLGRIAEIGSVTVTDLFTVERYPTLLQMTSGIEARLRADVPLPDLFASLFPCGSVTGAPKIRAMEIIHELEDRPRGVYCGSIGHIAPDGAARFNVAIRTAVLAPDGRFVFNVGSGVVYDSEVEAEYAECLLKARFLQRLTGTSA